MFALYSGKVGRTEVVEHSIDTLSHPSIRQAPCRIPFSLHPKVAKDSYSRDPRQGKC